MVILAQPFDFLTGLPDREITVVKLTNFMLFLFICFFTLNSSSSDSGAAVIDVATALN